MNQHGICQCFALIAWITLALPVFGQEPCKGYTHSRDGEVEAVYNLIIENGIAECTPTKASDYLECGSKGAVLWGDAISKILTASEPIAGSSVILTDAKKQRYHYVFAGYSESALAGLPRFSQDCRLELLYFSPMSLVMSEDPSRHALLVWVRRFNAFLPSSKPLL